MPPADPPDVRWHFFSRQAAALEHADSSSELQVWSLESSSQDQGKRSYIVASNEAFWRRYRSMIPHNRHYYEVIRAGRPCHLYFDLEYCRVANPQSDGDQMVRTLCSEVRTALGESYFNGRCPECRIVDLDSTTSRKFSRHVIVRISAAAFSNNVHAGSFVHALLSSLASRRADEPLIAALFVAPKASEAPRKPSAAANVCFVDTSVYTRNRCFRLCRLTGSQPSCHPELSTCTWWLL
jgi:hypothetical protein